jgi:glutamine amidotransferase/cyclase
VRTNDEGDLVVTKGDKYDVREKDEGPPAAAASGAADSADANGLAGAGAGAGATTAAPAPSRAVRNLGKPVDLCARYYAEGADEVVLLNITAFRSEPLDDAPLLGVLEAASERVFVPLTVRWAGIAHGVLPEPDSGPRRLSPALLSARKQALKSARSYDRLP